jgi:hypothetical protein
MTFQEFIDNYDFENSVILLEGKRDVLPDDVSRLVELGKLLTLKTRGIIFRSGNADGADYWFSQGVVSIDKSRLQVVTPYNGHRQKHNYAAETISLEEIDLADEPDVIYHSRSHKKTTQLVDQYIQGKRDRYSIKAAYIIRDTIKVTGTKKMPPASFAIFYDDLQHPRQGGTGHTMNVCQQNNIPFVDQKDWVDWLQ